MRALVPGRSYKVSSFDPEPNPTQDQTIFFVHREPIGEDKRLVTQLNGTTLREVLKACEACLKYLDAQVPDIYNEIAISNIQDAITLLDAREFDRKARGVHGRQVK